MHINPTEAEQILIGLDVCITILKPAGVTVAMYIDAPRDWTIIRQDIRTSPPTLIETRKGSHDA